MQVTKLHCYNHFARSFAKACQIQEVQHLMDPGLKVAGVIN